MKNTRIATFYLIFTASFVLGLAVGITTGLLMITFGASILWFCVTLDMDKKREDHAGMRQYLFGYFVFCWGMLSGMGTVRYVDKSLHEFIMQQILRF